MRGEVYSGINKSVMHVFRRALASKRRIKRLTQRGLDALAGLAEGTIAQYEYGRMPTVDSAIKIAIALGTTLDDLFEFEIFMAKKEEKNETAE